VPAVPSQGKEGVDSAVCLRSDARPASDDVNESTDDVKHVMPINPTGVRRRD